MIKEEIKLIRETPADLKKFGLSVGTVLFLIGAALFFFEKDSWIYFIIIGALLIAGALLFPKLLKPLNKVWMILAVLLGWVMTRVILILLFYLVVTPIALIGRIVGKEFLKLKIDKSADSYWELRERKVTQNVEYERQF